MNFFGIGGAELILILIIMLAVAGPKRMILWSRILGQYVGKFRVMWSQTVDMIQKEFDSAGLDVQLPKEPPTRRSVTNLASSIAKPISSPVQNAMKEVENELNQVKKEAGLDEKVDLSAPPASPSGNADYGAWSLNDPAAGSPQEPSNGSASLGSWSNPQNKKEQ